MTGKLHIVYASDDSFAMQTGISMLSLLKNNETLNICVYILANGKKKKNKINFEEIAKGKAELHFIDVLEILNEKIKNQGLTSYASSFAPYSRLFVAESLPENVSKVLYLDGDTIVSGSLMKLAQMDMENYSCAMVKDTRSEKYKKKIDLENIYEFYNSGVILINLDFWREHSTGDALLNDMLHFPTEFPDNNALCRVLKGTIKTLPLNYNASGMPRLFNNNSLYSIAFRSGSPFYSEMDLNEARENPIILHYTNYYLSGRPWFRDCFDKKGLQVWLSYYTDSPWASYEMHKEQYSGYMYVFVKISRILFKILPQKLFIILVVKFFEKIMRYMLGK
jgi:lipopolysaccharide biosynthesis glycosyltransferase